MPYRNGPVPDRYTPAYFKREYERIAEAYDYQDSLGGMSLGTDQGPIAQVLTSTKEKVNCWLNVTPSVDVGDGPVLTDPRVSPASEIQVFQDGIFIMSFFANFTHDQGAFISVELFLNDVSFGLGAIIDASQQSTASSLSVTGILPLNQNNVVDMRVSTDAGTEAIFWVSASFQVFKLRDLRTRFS